MKLRISGNSIRLRLLRSELATFIEQGSLEEKLHFGHDEHSYLTYALQWDADAPGVTVRSRQASVIVVLPQQTATTWAQREDQVGIYATVDLGPHGTLDIIVEKDFACLDLSDAENQDTFANPQLGVNC